MFRMAAARTAASLGRERTLTTAEKKCRDGNACRRFYRRAERHYFHRLRQAK